MDGNDLALVRPYTMLPSGNLSLRRSVFDALGGFSTAPGISEDMEFSVRLQQAGYRVGYAPDAKLYWRRPTTAREEYIKQHADTRRAAQTLSALSRSVSPGSAGALPCESVLWFAKCAPVAAIDSSRRIEWAGVAGNDQR